MENTTQIPGSNPTSTASAPTPSAGNISVAQVMPTSVNQQSQAINDRIKQSLAERIRRSANGENLEGEETIFTLRYKKGPVTNNVNFWCENNIDKAQLKARAFCDRFRFRFIWVEPFCIDIEAKPDYLTPEQAELDKMPVYK